MTATPHFLTQLGLDHEADLSAIRRAYAKKIKLIDPDLQPAEFQAMRETYECATSWVKWREAQAKAADRADQAKKAEETETLTLPTTAPATPPQVAHKAPQTEPAGPEQMAHAFHAFVEQLLVSGMPLPDAARCKSELEARLRKRDLIPLEAREMFERAAALYLAEGWKPGNDALFTAAIEVFLWSKSKNRLACFGPAGWRLNRAVMEWSILNRQYDEGHRRDIGLLKRMRDDAPPTGDELRFYGGVLANLMAQIGTVLPIVTNMGNKAPWLALPQQRTYAQAPRPTTLPREAYKAPSSRSWVLALCCLPICIALAINGLSHQNDYQLPRQQTSQPVINNATAPLPDYRKTLGFDDENNLRARLLSHMQFNTAQVSTGKLSSSGMYMAFIGSDGSLGEANVVQSSGTPQFDAAVIKAFHAAGPYPRGMGGRVQYLLLSPQDLR
ncbi:MAG TPA: hypothetical protein VF472_24940 [Burkholderiaceae bacterium]